jgi:hypothetical protein
MSSRFRPACAAFAVLITFTTVGCVDPQKSFDDYGERVPDAAPPADAAGGGGVFDISGAFLLSIQTSLGGPLRFVVEGELTQNKDGSATADLTFQPIITPSNACPNDSPGEPVGDELALTGLEIAADGTFDVVQSGAAAPREANPISCSDIVADIQFIGTLQSVDLFCGDVGGMVMMPIMLPLTGTFGAVRIAAAGEDPVFGDDNLPAALTACP